MSKINTARSKILQLKKNHLSVCLCASLCLSLPDSVLPDHKTVSVTAEASQDSAENILEVFGEAEHLILQVRKWRPRAHNCQEPHANNLDLLSDLQICAFPANGSAMDRVTWKRVTKSLEMVRKLPGLWMAPLMPA